MSAGWDGMDGSVADLSQESPGRWLLVRLLYGPLRGINRRQTHTFCGDQTLWGDVMS